MRINLRFTLLLLVLSSLWTVKVLAQASLNFDGVNDYVRIPNTVSATSAFTIEFWMKTTQTAANGTQWYNGAGLVDAEMPGAANDFGISLVGTKLSFGIGNTDKTIFSTSNVNTGAWVYVAAVWDSNATTMKLYINGVLEASATSGVPVAKRNASTAITLGAINTLNNYYNGSIDELRIWNVALAHPQDNINCPVGITTGLIASYNFNDGTANGANTSITNIADATGNNNIGTLNNFTLTGNTSNFTGNIAYPATSVSIVSNTANPYNGYNITFTAMAVTVGSDCTYQWYKNGSPIANATNATYVSAALTDNDQIYCVIRTSTACSDEANYQSNTITLHYAEAVKWYVKANAIGTGVGTSWTDAYTDLQAAINAAAPGDEVWVAAGTYTPALKVGYSMKESVKIYGGFPASGNPTFADRNYSINVTTLAGNNGRVITNDNNGITATAVLDGFTIARGTLNYGTIPDGSGMYIIDGGGMYNNNVSPTIQNCIFTDNRAFGNGGGVYNAFGAPVFTNCTFLANFCAYQSLNASGGGMANYNSKAILTDCRFTGNQSNGYESSGGGALYNQYADVIVNNCTFSDNSAYKGGGLYNRASKPVLTGCYFFNNTATLGGAVNISGYHPTSANATFVNCVFTNNNAVDGGAVYSHYDGNGAGNGAFTNCIFYANSNRNGGRGSVLYNSGSTDNLYNCVLFGNTSGSDVIFCSGLTVDIRNTVIYGNSGGVSGERVLGVLNLFAYNSLIQDNPPSVFSYTGNNINGAADPLFVDSSNPAGADGVWGTADDGLRLQQHSPLVGTGDNSKVTTATDIAGNTRIQKGRVDIGAYESTYSSPAILSNFANINKTYGDAAFNLTAPASTSDGTFSYTSSNEAVVKINGNTVTITGKGTATITATQAATANYNQGTISLELTVNKRQVTLTPASVTKPYGTAYTYGTTASAVTVTGSGMATGHTLTLAITSQGSGNTANVIASPFYGSDITSGSVLIRDGGNADVTGNYDITLQAGQLQVTKAPLTITAANETKVYDGLSFAGPYTVSYSGFVNGENENVLTGMLSYGGTSQTAVNVGTSYSITPSGLSAANYSISYTNGTLSITQRPLIINSASMTKVYGSIRAYTLADVAVDAATPLAAGNTLFSISQASILGDPVKASVSVIGSPYMVAISNAIIRKGGTDVTGNYTLPTIAAHWL